MLVVRSESHDDIAGIDCVVLSAFADGDQNPLEVRLVHELRSSESWIASLALVAVEEERIVGFCVSTRGYVGDTPVLALGPIAVSDERQGQGIGSALMNETIQRASTNGEKLVGLLGEPEYYSRFGFVPASETKVLPPDPRWGAAFQVLAFDAGIAGMFRYPPEFGV